jgi:DNA-binding response OmpR family regulator
MLARMAAPAPGKLILVVDDDRTVRTMVRQALETKGYEVMEAADGLQASELFGKLTRVPSLLICDVMMPSMDGFSLAKIVRAKKELSSMPIIFLTAKTNPLDVVKGIQAGARGYLTKPFKIETLREKVAKVLG